MGKEGAADFNFWPFKETSLSITLTSNFDKKSNRKMGNFENIANWKDGTFAVTYTYKWI